MNQLLSVALSVNPQEGFCLLPSRPKLELVTYCDVKLSWLGYSLIAPEAIGGICTRLHYPLHVSSPSGRLPRLLVREI